MVIVSLLTPPEPRVKMDSFFGRLQTPSDEMDSIESEESVFQPPTTDKARGYSRKGLQSILVNLLSIRKSARGIGLLRAYREDFRGFSIGWLLAVFLVLGTWLLLRL